MYLVFVVQPRFKDINISFFLFLMQCMQAFIQDGSIESAVDIPEVQSSYTRLLVIYTYGVVHCELD